MYIILKGSVVVKNKRKNNKGIYEEKVVANLYDG